MIRPIDVAELSAPAQRIVGPTAPAKMQEMAARGIAPGIRPGELVSVLVLLTTSENGDVRATATATLGKLPEPILAGALATDLPEAAIDALALMALDRLDVLEKLIAMPRISMETVEQLAQRGSEMVTELVATNEERLLANPRMIELLYMNRRTRMSTADRLVDLAIRNGITLTGLAAFKEIAAALQDELIPCASDEPTPDDLLFSETEALAAHLSTAEDEDAFDLTDEGKEVLKEEFLPIYARIANMPVSQKVRRAILGTKEERMLLIRDSNKIVAASAARSPLMQESEVALISRNRNLSEEVLRIIASSPEWLKSYQIKKNLVENPKTPAMISTRLINQLRETDLRMIAKSKNVTGAVAEAARRHLSRRKG